MTDSFQQPRATCPVLLRPPGELEPWTAHMVSMTQALQSGASLTICPGRITWTTPDSTTLDLPEKLPTCRTPQPSGTDNVTMAGTACGTTHVKPVTTQQADRHDHEVLQATFREDPSQIHLTHHAAGIVVVRAQVSKF